MTHLLLQRQRTDGDRMKWRTVLRVGVSQMREVERWVADAQALDGLVRWRLTTADGKAALSTTGQS